MKILKNNYKIAAILIWVIALFGLYGTLGLASKEFSQGNVCPKLVGIPACYIIMACFLLVLIGHSRILKKLSWFYFIGAITAWLIATFGTTGETMGWTECPKTSGGTPMCYISFAMFSSLLIFKIIELSNDKKQ